MRTTTKTTKRTRLTQKEVMLSIMVRRMMAAQKKNDASETPASSTSAVATVVAAAASRHRHRHLEPNARPRPLLLRRKQRNHEFTLHLQEQSRGFRVNKTILSFVLSSSLIT